jgi:hypothetical protein
MKALVRYIADELEWRRCETFDEQAAAVLGLIEERGYAIVPKEPTEEMLTAGEALDHAAAPGSGHSTQYARCEDHYGAMLAAAPKVMK